MKIGNLEISWGRRATSGVNVAVSPTKKSAGFGQLLEMVLDGVIGRGLVTKPFSQSSNVYKAIKAIADNAPQAEIALYKEGTNEETNDERLETLLYRPNERQSYLDFVEEVAGTFAYNGEVFIRKIASMGQVAGTSKLPAQLIVLKPSEVKEILDKQTNVLIGWELRNREKLSLDEVIHVKTFNPDNPHRGASPIAAIDGEIQLDYASLMFNRQFFENDATPGFTLTTDKSLTVEQRERLTEWMKKQHKGAKNAHKIAVFDSGLKPTTTGSSHKDMEFLEQKKYTREEILGNWRAPKALFNITEDLNYATFVGQMKIFWIYSIMPILRKVEEGLNFGLVTPYNPKIYFAFKLDNVPAFQEDFKEKVSTAKILFDMGFTADEINQKLNLGFDEKDWRKHWWIGFGQVPAETALEEALNPPDAPDPAAEPDADEPKGRLHPKDAFGSLRAWKSFVVRQSPIESRFASKIRNYFFQLRSECLRELTANGVGNPDKLINWGAADEQLKKIASPLILRAIESGVEIGQEQLGKKGVLEDTIAARIQGLLAVRANKIVGVNRTIQNRVRETLEAGVKDGDTIVQLSDRVRDVFNASAARGLTIARTETSGAVNGGTEIYYKETGVEKKKWVTAGDESVRETHRQIDGEVQYVGDRFSNGLHFPSDQEGDAAEVINCRCALVPVL